MRIIKMFKNDLNKELETAVREGNLEKVKALVSAGANVNYKSCEWNMNEDSLLHISKSTEITKELLLCGADVNAKNLYRETPLHSAITGGSNLELVRELLKHRAYVNATNRKGNTALNLAVKKSYKNLEVIKELLKHESDINLKNRECRLYDNHNSPLDNAMACLDVAKLLVKITLMNNFDKDYVKIIDLNPYTEWSNYSEISGYLEDCVVEISKMKTDEISEGHSLYECATNNFGRQLVYNYNQFCVKLAKTDYSIHYPMYKDILEDVLDKFINRGKLLIKLDYIRIYTNFEGKQIILDYDSTYDITEYLSTEDLVNLILAFEDSKKHDTEVCSVYSIVEPSTSCDSKRIKLE